LPGLAPARPWRPRHAANDNRVPVRLRLARLAFALLVAALVALAIWLA
jgi:hypothetical protein